LKPAYQSEHATLYLGDCLSVLPGLADGSVNAVVTDPPYFLPATHYNVRSGSHRSLTDLGILEHYFASVFKATRRALSDEGFAYVFCDGQSYPVMYVTAYPHFKKLRPLVWDKQVSINGYGWRHQHELILWAESERSPTIPTGDGDVLKCRAVPIDDRKHLAQKPVELLRKLIEKVPAPVVGDWFMGSGATGEACLKAGRRFVGIEKDPAYFAIAVKRIEAAESEKKASLFAS
jgi:site-specific DNA-methyltransferase (adenine-specific)